MGIPDEQNRGPIHDHRGREAINVPELVVGGQGVGGGHLFQEQILFRATPK
jgi:hypothetical protein